MLQIHSRIIFPGIVQTELNRRLKGWNIRRSERVRLDGLSGKACGLGVGLKDKEFAGGSGDYIIKDVVLEMGWGSDKLRPIGIEN